ncbi:histidine phosphatase family protein [Nonomuraea sp. KC401]|uniref:histidine phosphatase family protein n=1 Tax=unclassified Nonomuraea TaxID=2593643 RepID=UPI0010FD038A|nr:MULTISPECIES: histidine phosphatase family protein [unclassified Nonomuraea]NBE95837.1 histidine phosphatase family protein [Nonomuraea sp. K271]TLF71976.1 histidine phosphatase family protein [Nonomuraea sp. KC401]
MLLLVRHAMPAHGPAVPAHEWTLSAEGWQAARRLVARLPGDARLVSSEERKAWQTLGGYDTITRDRRFNEVTRVEPWEGDYRELRRAYVEGADHPDWEPRADVAERFDAGITEQLVRAGGRPLVMATHGMAMTVWAKARLGLKDPGGFWTNLRFPDAHLVELDSGTVERAFAL